MDNEPQYIATVTFRAGDSHDHEGSWEEMLEWLRTQNNVQSVEIDRIAIRKP